MHSTRNAQARRDGLAALAAAEAYARNDDTALAACEPATPEETAAQRNLLVMALGDVIDAGGQQFVDAVRAALIEGTEELTSDQSQALKGIEDDDVRRVLAAVWENEQRIMRGKDTE